MTETPHPDRQGPRKRSTEVEVADFTILVRVPTKPATFRAFTADEEAEAEARNYVQQNGGTIVPLPLPMPDGYPANA